MRPSRNPLLYSLVLLFLSTFTAAWPWPRWLPELDSLVVRQNDNSNSNSNSDSGSGSGSSSGSGSAIQTGSPTTANTNSAAPSSTGSNTNKATTGSSGTVKQTGTSTKSSDSTGKGSSTSSKAEHTSYDARLPAGGVSLLEPNIISGSQFYKIGDFVTFAWNYTSLSATPTAVNIMATCTANQQMYTIAMNQTIGNATQAVTWDTGAYQQTALSDPLLTEVYTLIIYDAASSISAQAQAGYLAVYDQYSFGMYTPQPYTPLNEYVCVTCSGALSEMERRALGMVFGVAIVTVLSFTWFVGGVSGIIW